MKEKKNLIYSIKHTIKRLEERYNIKISEEDYYTLCQFIPFGTIIFDEKDMNQQIIDIVWNGQKIRVVWDYLNQRIRTVIKEI